MDTVLSLLERASGYPAQRQASVFRFVSLFASNPLRKLQLAAFGDALTSTPLSQSQALRYFWHTVMLHTAQLQGLPRYSLYEYQYAATAAWSPFPAA